MAAVDDDGGPNQTASSAAIYANAFKPVDPWVHSTGFRTHPLRHRVLGHSPDGRVAEEFLINTRYQRYDRESEASIESYFTDASYLMVSRLGQEEPSGQAEIPLPAGVDARMELGEALRRRHSSRLFTGDRMELEYLATIIRGATATTREATLDLSTGDTATMRFRTAPSGGGLYPIELYLAALRVKKVDRGVYSYSTLRDSLLRIGDEAAIERLLTSFVVPDEVISISRAAAIVFLIARPWRSMRKYGSRGMRYLLIEAGAITQNIHLTTEALGYGSVDCASTVDDEVHDALNLDGLYRALVHTVVLGYPG